MNAAVISWKWRVVFFNNLAFTPLPRALITGVLHFLLSQPSHFYLQTYESEGDIRAVLVGVNASCMSLWKMAGKCPILGWGEKESFVNDLRRLWGEPSLFGTRGGFFQYIALRIVQKLCLFSWCTEVYKTFCEGCESKKCEISVRTRVVPAHARNGSK